MNTHSVRIADLLVPALVVAVVGIMVLPLPPLFLNTFIVLNIAISLVLLVTSVYIGEPQRFTTLPSLLLFATLFRLALNISTTRQLLAYGFAPDIVQAFGEFVVQGNVVVGLVIFLIITLVQFIVVAKGAERVAEVSARFTLDALPGKQMSIDADVRAGLLNVEEARRKRHDLQQESRLYGALDGAMKFVKGDAIAGLIITAVNILGGFIVGIYQLGLPFEEALRKFTIFSVGDGLASQIPALLVTVAAGIVVTRVAGEEDSIVGRELVTQLGSDSRVLGTTACALFILSIVPGMPLLPFLCSGAGCAFLAWKRLQEHVPHVSDGLENRLQLKVLSRLLLRFSPELAQNLREERRLPAMVTQIRADMFGRHGIVIPEAHFEILHPVDGHVMEVSIDGVSRKFVSFSDGSRSEQVVEVLTETLETHILDFVDDTQTRNLLQIHQPVCEDLIHVALPAMLSVTQLTSVLRRLLIERVSVQDLRAILQAVLEFSTCFGGGKAVVSSQGEIIPPELLAAVRVKLAPAIIQDLKRSDEKLCVWLLPEDVESRLEEEIRKCGVEESDLRNALVESIRKKLERDVVGSTVFVVRDSLRSAIAQLCLQERLSLSVLAFREVEDYRDLAIMGMLSIEYEDSRQPVHEPVAFAA